MSKVDYSSLDFTSEKEVKKYNKEVEEFLDGKSKNVSPEAIAFCYLTLHKIENEQEEKRRGLSLEETNSVIRELQGQVLTLLEAVIEGYKIKPTKDIINNYFSNAQSKAQDIDWGRYDGCGETAPKQPEV